MKRNENVTHVMSKELVTVNKTTKLSDARDAMVEFNIHHLPVEDGGKLVGVLSYNDILRVSTQDAFGTNKEQADAVMDHTLFMEDAMSKDVVAVNEKHSIREAAAVLSSKSFHSLPVVDDENNILGIVTTKDLLKYFLEQY